MKIKILCNEESRIYEQDCAKVFDENNCGFIVNREGIFDRKKFNLFVVVIDNVAVAYQLIYIGGDFVKGETYDEAYNNGFVYEDDAVYIWDMCTAKAFENNGLQQKLIKYLIKYFKGHNIYSLTDVENKKNIHIQNKLGFKNIGEFLGHKNETYIVFKKDNNVYNYHFYYNFSTKKWTKF